MDAKEENKEKVVEKKDSKAYHFKRINASNYDGKILEHFADNTFEAKARFG